MDISVIFDLFKTLAVVLLVVLGGLERPQVLHHRLLATRLILLLGEGLLVRGDLAQILHSGLHSATYLTEAHASLALIGVVRVTELMPRRYRRLQSGLVVGAVRWVANSICWSAAWGDFLLIFDNAPLTVLIPGAHTTFAILLLPNDYP